MNDSMLIFSVIIYGFAILFLIRLFFDEHSLSISFKGVYNALKFLFLFIVGGILLFIILFILGWIIENLSFGIDDVDNIQV